MRASISVGNLELIESNRPSSEGELTTTLRNDDIGFLLQLSKEQAVKFSIDGSSARVLIAALDQLASSLERKFQPA
jgi:hypothetical protein